MASAAETVRALEERAEAELERTHVPGIAFGVLAGGERAVGAAGVADLSAGTHVRPETLFRVASITKPFVAMLVMTLVQDGLLSLDAPLTDVALVDGRVTLRQLLSHQAGLEHEWSRPLDEYGEGDDVLDRLLGDPPAAAATGAGEWFSYSSAGFYLAAAVSARAAGTTFEEAMRARVLEPLGLRRTTFDVAEAERLGLVRGHEQVEPGSDEHRVQAEDRYPRARRAGGGLLSCATDLLAFAGHHLGAPGPLDEASRREMQTPQVDAPGGSYGLGWGIRTLAGRKLVEHGGALGAYQSLLLLLPEEGFAFVGLANSGRGRRAIDPLRDIALRLACGIEAREPVAREPDPAALEEARGTYRAHEVEIRLARAERALRLELAERDPVSGRTVDYPPLVAAAVGGTTFAILDGDSQGTLIELLEPGLVRVGGRVARRVD